MLTFVANARDGSSSSAMSCGQCACESVSVKPGETNKWLINYANWVAPISGPGIVSPPAYQFELVTPANVTASGNQPPSNTDYVFTTTENVAAIGNVALNAVDLEGNTLVYKSIPLYGPTKGRLVLNGNGTLTYTPFPGTVGYDTFFFTTSDGLNRPVVNKAVVIVNPVAGPNFGNPPTIPVIWVDPLRISTKRNYIEFPLIVSPAAKIGDMWRMIVVQTALDCDGNAYRHEMCFDIVVSESQSAAAPRAGATTVWNGVQW